MNPQIVVGYDLGAHNSSLEQSAARIMEGGSWKKQRTILLIPAGKKMDTRVALAMRALAFPPNQQMYPMAAVGMEVGDAYSNAIKWITETPGLNEWEYIFTIEHDNIGPPDGVVKLIYQMEQHPEFACIGGLYWTKGWGGVPQIWGDPKDAVLNFRPQVPRAGELVECCGTGMGFNVWRLSMFRDERLRRPWFKTNDGREGGGIGTQDLHFWTDARQYGYRAAVDCSVLVGHFDPDSEKTW
jgi:hypothetical protein